MVYLEKACDRFGLRFHSKRGLLFFKQFILYLFPNGNEFASSQTIIKKLNIQKFATLIMLTEFNYPNFLTKTKFQEFWKIQSNVQMTSTVTKK
jgi:hypothetical protein